MIERKIENFETDDKNWKVIFDIETEHQRGQNILVSLILNKDERKYLTSEDIRDLKQDLKDLGKFRIIKRGKMLLDESRT
jgi:hypothetical protein